MLYYNVLIFVSKQLEFMGLSWYASISIHLQSSLFNFSKFVSIRLDKCIEISDEWESRIVDRKILNWN